MTECGTCRKDHPVPHRTIGRDLRRALDDFDGRNVTTLSEVDAAYQASEGFRDAVILLIDDADPLLQRAATWLVHHGSLQTDAGLGPQLAPRLAGVRDWQAVLHLLQLAANRADETFPSKAWAGFVQSYLDHERPFLRAWAMAALCRFAHHDARLRERATAARDAALNDTAASVRARARNTPLPD